MLQGKVLNILVAESLQSMKRIFEFTFVLSIVALFFACGKAEGGDTREAPTPVDTIPKDSTRFFIKYKLNDKPFHYTHTVKGFMASRGMTSGDKVTYELRDIWGGFYSHIPKAPEDIPDGLNIIFKSVIADKQKVQRYPYVYLEETFENGVRYYKGPNFMSEGQGMVLSAIDNINTWTSLKGHQESDAFFRVTSSKTLKLKIATAEQEITGVFGATVYDTNNISGKITEGSFRLLLEVPLL